MPRTQNSVRRIPVQGTARLQGRDLALKSLQTHRRFSEDIDLVLDWKVLGDGQDLAKQFDSKSQQDKFNKEINRRAGIFIAENICPQLYDLFQRAKIDLKAQVDANEPQVVNITYPAAFSEAYIRPEVRLEIGPLAAWVPSAAHTVRPYAFDVHPELFENPDCPVIAIAAERAFWEKATPPPGGAPTWSHSRPSFEALLRPLQTRLEPDSRQGPGRYPAASSCC